MNIEAYNLDSLRKLVRALQAENKELRELLEKAEIPYSSSEVFGEIPVRKEEFPESYIAFTSCLFSTASDTTLKPIFLYVRRRFRYK